MKKRFEVFSFWKEVKWFPRIFLGVLFRGCRLPIHMFFTPEILVWKKRNIIICVIMGFYKGLLCFSLACSDVIIFVSINLWYFRIRSGALFLNKLIDFTCWARVNIARRFVWIIAWIMFEIGANYSLTSSAPANKA